MNRSKILVIIGLLAVNLHLFAVWTTYESFASNAIMSLRNKTVLLSASYTNDLVQTIATQPATNALSGGARLMLGVRESVYDLENGEERMGAQCHLEKFLDFEPADDALWCKACALTLMGSACVDAGDSLRLFDFSTNVLERLQSCPADNHGGMLYLEIAKTFGAENMSLVQSLKFATANLALLSGMTNQGNALIGDLPSNARSMFQH